MKRTLALLAAGAFVFVTSAPVLAQSTTPPAAKAEEKAEKKEIKAEEKAEKKEMKAEKKAAKKAEKMEKKDAANPCAAKSADKK